MNEFKNLAAYLCDNPNPEAAIPVPLVADYLNVTPSAILQQVQSGKLEGHRIGKHTFVSLPSLLKLGSEETQRITKLKNFLIDKARNKYESLHYEEVMNKIGLSWKIPYHRKLIGRYLGEVSRQTYADNKVLLSVLVHYKGGGGVGKGFFTLAQELGFNWKSEEAFVNDQTKKVWKHYHL